MPYIIGNTDGTITYTLEDNIADTSTFSIALLGKNTPNYAEYWAKNSLQMLENFAGELPPDNPIIGQFWYDKGGEVIRVWDGQTWRSSTGIVVGAEQSRPTTNLNGTAFFNKTTNQLEINDGTRWKNANYAGEVTSRFSSDDGVGRPLFYGTRIRNLFLEDETGQRSIPVLAVTYVKSGVNPENRGATKVGEQYETIMALFSDEEFFINTSGTNTLVEGVIVDYAPELVAPDGIAAAQTGRPAGKILRGLNLRNEYSTTDTGRFDQLYANTIGTHVDPVSSIITDELTILSSLTLENDLFVDRDIITQGTVQVDGVVSTNSRFETAGGNSDVWNNALQPGDNVSLLANDAGYINVSILSSELVSQEVLTNSVLSSYLGITNIDEIATTTTTNVSEFFNDAGYINTSTFTGGDGVSYVGGTISLETTGVSPGTYGDATTIPRITVDQYGRLIDVLEEAIDTSFIELTSLSVSYGSPVAGGNLTYDSATGVFTFSPDNVVTSLTDLGIVDGNPGDILSTDGAGNFTFSSFTPSPSALGTIASDVSSSSASDGQVLIWDTTEWVPQSLTLDSLGDISISSPSPGQVLQWNGSEWIGGPIVSGVLGDVTGPNSSVDNNIASFNGATGKIIRDSGKAVPTGDIVGTTDTQILSNKSFATINLTGGSGTNFISMGATDRMDFTLNSGVRMSFTSGSRVGIGTISPGFSLDVNGDIRATGDIIAFSDERLKENIQTLDGSKVFEMRGVSYEKDGTAGAGVIAQEIENVAPELVCTDEEGYKSVAYGNITGYLIETVKMLKNEIDDLKGEIERMKNASS